MNKIVTKEYKNALDKANKTSSKAVAQRWLKRAKIAHLEVAYGITRDEYLYIQNGNRSLRSKRRHDAFIRGYGIKPDMIHKVTRPIISKKKQKKLGKKYHKVPALTEKGAMFYLRQTKQIRHQLWSRFHKDAEIYQLPDPIRTIWNKANDVSYSMVSGLNVEKYSGLNRTSVYRLRNPRTTANGKRGSRHYREYCGLEMTSIRSLLLLANYNPKRTFTKNRHKNAKGKIYTTFLTLAESRFNFDEDQMKGIIGAVLEAPLSMAEKSRECHIDHQKMTHMKNLGYDLMSLHAITLSRFIHEYRHLVDLGKIIPESKQKKQEKRNKK